MNQMMKSLAVATSAALVAALSACGGSGAVTNQSSADFQTTISQPGVIVLDVRTAGEFATGHLQNAVNIDVEGMQFDSEISRLDKNATYAVYCHSGRRSGIATGKMADAGFTHLYNLDGGIAAWAAAGLPVTQ